jgi:hypothetical protein
MRLRLLLFGMLCMLAWMPARPVRAETLPGAGEPLVKPAFRPLPPGAVEPAGWLRDWAEAARDGITGHLDEYHAVFGDAWKGTQVKAPNAAGDGTGWPLEQCSYWLDGLVRLGYVLHDELLLRKAKARLDPIVDGVNQGGPSFIYWISNSPTGFNSWAHSHMGRALVAYYEATGEKRILDALDKAYRSYPVPMGNLELTDVNVSGLCNLDALLETYSFTGDKRLLERATSAVQRPEVQASIQDWLQGKFNPCHAVCAYELIRLPALLYPWTGEPRYLEATRHAFQWFEHQHLLPYGVTSGEEFLSGVGGLSVDRDMRRDGGSMVEPLDVSHYWRKVMGRRHGAGVLQCGRRAGGARFSDHVLLPIPQSHPAGILAERPSALPRSGLSAVYAFGLPGSSLLRRRGESHPA